VSSGGAGIAWSFHNTSQHVCVGLALGSAGAVEGASEGLVYVSTAGGVQALNGSTGVSVWSVDTESQPAGLLVAAGGVEGDVVVFGTALPNDTEYSIVAVSGVSGTVLWQVGVEVPVNATPGDPVSVVLGPGLQLYLVTEHGLTALGGEWAPRRGHGVLGGQWLCVHVSADLVLALLRTFCE
jgi:outer membrane protein assembly factor BamB